MKAFHPRDLRAFEQHPDLNSIQQLLIHPQLLAQVNEKVLLQCKQIQVLVLSTSATQLPLPMAVFSWRKLRSLTLRGVQIAPLWPHLARLPLLQALQLQVKNLERLPDALLECTQLQELDWLDSSFSERFEGWQLLEYLPRVKWLNLLRAHFKRPLLEGLEELDLHGLLLPKRHQAFFEQQHPTYCNNLWYRYQYTSAENKFYSKISSYAQSESLDLQQRALLLNLLTQNSSQVDRLATPERLLSIVDLPVSAFALLRLAAIEYYIPRWHPNAALTSTAYLSVLGQLASNKNHLRQQLKALGITISYSGQLDSSTTHILLGQRPKEAYQAALAQNLPFLSEANVLDYISTHSDLYLVQEAESEPEQLANISRLLTSNQDENVRLALAFFEQGGFPRALLTPLFYAYHTTEEQALRQQVGRLLRQYGSHSVSAAILGWSPNYYHWGTESSLQKHWQTLQKTTDLDVLFLARTLYQQQKNGLAFLLKALPLEEGSQLLRSLVRQKELQLKDLSLTSLPPCVYTLTELEVLDVSNNNLRSVPLVHLKKMPQLQRLVAHRNKGLRDNKKWRDSLRTTLPQLTVQL